MTSRCFKPALYGATALSIFVPLAAFAQDAGGGVEEIVVTAQRRVERLQDVPISISVFNQQQLSNHDVVNASDLAEYTPSLSVNTNFGSQNTSFAIRGFTQDIDTAPNAGR
jgi:iron complex outermembrane receptor protein